LSALLWVVVTVLSDAERWNAYMRATNPLGFEAASDKATILAGLRAVEAAVRADMQREVEAPVAPWDRLDGCFGHCDPEGWYAPCTLTSSTPNQQGAEQ
jgi:hypothetical protein